MKHNRRKLCYGDFLVRSTGISAVLIFIAQMSFARDAVPDIECAITEECNQGTCSPIKPKPLLFRYVQFPEQLVAWVYGSPRIIGGPEQDSSRAFGYQLKNGRSLVVIDGKHGLGGDHIWFDLPAPDNSLQRSFVSTTLLRGHEGHCITRIVIQPSRPAMPDWSLVNGLGGECRWSQNLCSPTDGGN